MPQWLQPRWRLVLVAIFACLALIESVKSNRTGTDCSRQYVFIKDHKGQREDAFYSSLLSPKKAYSRFWQWICLAKALFIMTQIITTKMCCNENSITHWSSQLLLTLVTGRQCFLVFLGVCLNQKSHTLHTVCLSVQVKWLFILYTSQS